MDWCSHDSWTEICRSGSITSGSGSCRLICEHLLQTVNDIAHRVRRQATEAFRKAFSVDGAKLVKRNEARSLLKTTENAPRIRLATSGQGRHDCRVQMLIELVRRHNDARACLSNFAAEGWIEPNEVNVAA